MKPDERKKLLQEQLERAIDLNAIYNLDAVKKTLIPILEEVSKIQWLDPMDKDFTDKYKIAYAKAQAYQSLISVMKNSENQIAKLKLQLETPEKNWSTGS